MVPGLCSYSPLIADFFKGYVLSLEFYICEFQVFFSFFSTRFQPPFSLRWGYVGVSFSSR